MNVVARLACAALLLFVLPAPAQQSTRAPARDWQRHPAILQLQTQAPLFAVSDVHGDYERFTALLTAGKLIARSPERPEQVEWIGGDAWLICVGDHINKGSRSFDVLALLRALQTAAARRGGGVAVTMGNHEAVFVSDPFAKKVKMFCQELQDRKIAPLDVAAGRDADGLGAFLRSLPLAVQVDDWFFAHAGYTRGRSRNQLELEIRQEVDAHGFDVDLSPALHGLLEARLHEPIPWWERLGEHPERGPQRLARYAAVLGARHLVVGHQAVEVTFADKTKRARGEMFSYQNGLLFLIDTGMSRGADKLGNGYSEGALLRIAPGPRRQAEAIYPDGSARLLWSAGK